MTAQITGFAQLLRVQKIDMTIFQHFLVKRLVGNHNALTDADLVCLLLDLLP